MSKILMQTEIENLDEIIEGSAAGKTAVQPGDLAAVATSGSYNDLSDKPTIPTVNNATLTIQKNGTSIGSFTANSSTDVTANIDVPTKTSDLTNDSGFIDNTYHDTTKQDVISDLETIRAGAALGATALQEHQDISGKANLASPAFTGVPTAPTAATGTNTAQLATTEFVSTAIQNLPSPMVFKGTLGNDGTITDLPTSNVRIGDTYKVITAGTYAGKAANVGDMFIAIATTPTWELVPSGDEPVGTVTNVATGAGLTGGPITSSGTIALNSVTQASLALADSAVQPATLTQYSTTTEVQTMITTAIGNAIAAGY